MVSYVTNDEFYRSSGFLKTIKNKYFALIEDIAANPVSFCIQFANVNKMYVSNPKKTNGDEINITLTKKEATNFPVKINKHVVYYAKSNFDRKRFMKTTKYENMVA